MKVFFYGQKEYTFSMKIFRSLVSVFLAFCIVFMLFIGLKKIGEGKELEQKPAYKGILSLWQIDSFEGGVGSRKQFLLDRAAKFEKKNEGVLIMVVSYTAESAEEKIKNGEYPDMVSFGNGFEGDCFCKLDIEGFKGGNIGEQTYAVPWCRGGYVLISKSDLESAETEEKLTVSQGEYTQPVLAAFLEGITAKTINVLAPMNAYINFVEGKTTRFIGTQRDINRLERRGAEYSAKPLNKFNDLYQYISISTRSEEKKFYAAEFIEYLLSEESQKKLCDIGMLPCKEISVNEGVLGEMEKVKNLYTVSAFLGKDKYKEIQELSVKAFEGNENAFTKIKNMII